MNNAVDSWNQWKQQKIAEYSFNEIPMPKQIATMIAYYGKFPEKTCENCTFFHFFKSNKNKWSMLCSQFGNRKAWKKEWPACGKYVERSGEKS